MVLMISIIASYTLYRKRGDIDRIYILNTFQPVRLVKLSQHLFVQNIYWGTPHNDHVLFKVKQKACNDSSYQAIINTAKKIMCVANEK